MRLDACLGLRLMANMVAKGEMHVQWLNRLYELTRSDGMTNETPERPNEPNQSKFGKLGGSSSDELIHADDEFYRLRDLALQPDPPATLKCNVCGLELEKNMDNIGSYHCDQPLREMQLKKAIDANLLQRILKAKEKLNEV